MMGGVGYGIAAVVSQSSRAGGIGLIAYHAVKGLVDRELLAWTIAYNRPLSGANGKRVAVLWAGALNKVLRSAGLSSERAYRITNVLFDTMMSRLVKKHQVVHGWTGSSRRTFERARALGGVCVLDCASTHPRDQAALLEQEARKWGGKGQAHSEERQLQRCDAELDLAHHIIVPAAHVEESLASRGIAREKLVRVPFGMDARFHYPRPASDDSKFRVLFPGLLGYRKGLLYLLEAWRRAALPASELVVAGHRAAEVNDLDLSSVPNAVHVGYLDRYALREKIWQSDIIALPSLEEGMSLVINDAMACGRAVLVTKQTGSPVEHGVSGYLVSARSEGEIVNCLVDGWKHRKELRRMGERAAMAISEYSWERYEERLGKWYENLLSSA